MERRSNHSLYKRLDQLGIDLGEGLALSITDASKLTDALTNNYSEVAALFEGVLEKVQSTVKCPVCQGDRQ